MERVCATARAAGLACLSLALVVGGCPSGVTSDGLSDADALLGGVIDEKDVFQVLSDTVDAEPAQIELASEVADELPAFGEPTELFDRVGADAVELPEEEIVLDTQIAGAGGPPPLHGRLAGRYLLDRPGSSSDESGGVFRGRWFAANDEVSGYVRGMTEPLSGDELPEQLIGGGVFRGKLVDLEGRFRGVLRGRYGHAQDGRTLFVGRWHDQRARLVGVLKGHWTDDPDGGGGVFAGRWAAARPCEQAEALVDPAFDGGSDAADAAFAELEAELDALLEAGLVETDVSLVTGLSETGAPDGAFEITPDEQGPEFLAGDGPCSDGNHGRLRGWHRPGVPDGVDPQRPIDGVWRARWRSAAGDAGAIVGVYRVRGPGPGGDPNDTASDGTASDGTATDGTASNGAASEGAATDGGALDSSIRPLIPVGLPIADAARGSGGDPNAPSGRPGVRGVFFGRVSNDAGEPIGVIRGVFGRGPHGMGVFRARYLNADGILAGLLRGRWDNAPERPGGPLYGVWMTVPRGDGAAP